ncbi:PQQ-binding-like beta-propeller repeat protein [candidate division KSB1 bacterium]|nr:PQQ-binding-like beta-propeller repeat protein [candidate division KSB1 bacterium]
MEDCVMKTRMFSSTILFVFAFSLIAPENNSDAKKNWANWRGPFVNGVAPNGNPPIEWSESKNIKWKIEIPGKGHATPIVWGDQMFILTAVETEKVGKTSESKKDEDEGDRGGRRRMSGIETDKIHKFVVLSVNKNNGKIIWEKVVREELPHNSTHRFGSWASNSPVTDGKHVYAYFGSRGLYCLDMNGNVKWERDFGDLEKARSFGEGSSPVLYKDKIFILWDHEGESFLVALDKNTGRDIWNINRDEKTSWSSPFFVECNGKPQMITSATNQIRSHDPSDGTLIWHHTGLTRNVIPMPVSLNNMVYIMSGFRGAALFAIDLSKAKGDLTNSDAVVWQYNQDTPYTPSPLLMKNKLYFLKNNNGLLTCLNAKDGHAFYSTEKLEGIGSIFTSPVGVSDRIYILGVKGLTYVVKEGDKFEVLAKNKLDDNFEASPVIIDNNLYLRGYKFLYCIADE